MLKGGGRRLAFPCIGVFGHCWGFIWAFLGAIQGNLKEGRYLLYVQYIGKSKGSQTDHLDLPQVKLTHWFKTQMHNLCQRGLSRLPVSQSSEQIGIAGLAHNWRCRFLKSATWSCSQPLQTLQNGRVKTFSVSLSELKKRVEPWAFQLLPINLNFPPGLNLNFFYRPLNSKTSQKKQSSTILERIQQSWHEAPFASLFSSQLSINQRNLPIFPRHPLKTPSVSDGARAPKIGSASHHHQNVNGAMAGEFPTSGCQEVMASGKETERSSHATRQSSENFRNSY